MPDHHLLPGGREDQHLEHDQTKPRRGTPAHPPRKEQTMTALQPARTGRPTLVLNAAGQPLGAIPLSRALSLTLTGAATAVETDGILRSPSITIDAPTVICRVGWVPGPTGTVAKVSRSALFARDNWTCGWCGRSVAAGDLTVAGLTIDHIVPQARFRPRTPDGRRACSTGVVQAAHRWDNVVTSCVPCNHSRGDTDPDWAALRVTPQAPSRLLVMSRQLSRLSRGAWDAYLPAA
jgi:5-methylcytosine-specific restriction endonuclease McrA